jgi:hypothetical protein
MDTSINVARLSRRLYRRGTHRLLGNPFLGSLTAFLTLLLLIRIAANFYIVVKISITNPDIDAVQIASAHFIYLSAYAVWVGTLSVCRIGLALPRLCSVDFALHGKRFRSMFVRQAALFRPVTTAYLSMMLLTAFVFSAIRGSWGEVSARGLIVLSSTLAAVIIVTAVAFRSALSRSEIQLMEILYLLFLLVLNPDIGSYNGSVDVFFFFAGLHYSFSGLWQVASAMGLIAVLALLVLLLVRVLTGVGNWFGRRIPLRPVEKWYWRFLRIRSWIFLYAVVAPVFLSSTISPGVKRWTLGIAMLFAVASYLYFITHIENTLHEKWRCSLFEKGNTRLIARSAVAHAVLTAIPVLGYFVLS